MTGQGPDLEGPTRAGARVIDSHAHLWQRHRNPQPWIDPVSMAAIDRDFWIPELEADLPANSGAVVVQASNSLDESRDLLAAAATSPAILGVVGWVDLERDVIDQVSSLLEAPGGEFLVGIRHLVHQDADPQWLGRESVGAGLDALGRIGLPFELVLNPSQLQLAAEVVASHQGTRFILDHLGKPPIRSGSLDRWSEDLVSISSNSNVVAKLSGLTIEADWLTWIAEDLHPVVDVALHAFGPYRLLFGSDWPLVLLTGGRRLWATVLDGLLTSISENERAAIFADNAARTYRIAN
ncbi:amidohydrolase family protein [Leifsonia sp. NPDC056665]|uniref:amidohydrolase family protein n=1 Tax=Leifsonia sp. NPDC056665 TaxID=3345901 RepID=UPI0036CF5441